MNLTYTVCLFDLPPDQFHKATHSKRGYSSRCKACDHVARSVPENYRVPFEFRRWSAGRRA